MFNLSAFKGEQFRKIEQNYMMFRVLWKKYLLVEKIIEQICLDASTNLNGSEQV